MEAINAIRVVTLTRRLQTLKQIMALIDQGATIVSMTLRAPEAPPAPPVAMPEPVESIDDAAAAEGDDEHPPIEPDEPPPEDGEVATGPTEMTVSTEGIEYPPQMLAGIRAQEQDQWQKTYDELAQLGVTDVPPLQIQPAPTAARVAPPARAARPAPPVRQPPPRQPAAAAPPPPPRRPPPPPQPRR